MLRFLLSSLVFATSTLALAVPSVNMVSGEVDTLLSRLGSSGCKFNRNGEWHEAQQAREHLLAKLEFIQKRTDLRSAEEFIELAASRSSMSGNPYLVQCPGEPVVQSRAWLLNQLQIARSGKPPRPPAR